MINHDTFNEWKKMHYISFLSQGITHDPEFPKFLESLKAMSCAQIEREFIGDKQFRAKVREVNKQRPKP